MRYPDLTDTGLPQPGSASIGEIVETVIKREGFSDAQQAVLHNNGPETEIGYRLAWARTYLKSMGLLTNSARGVWALTDEGTALVTDPSATDEQRRERVREIWSAYLIELRKARKARQPEDGSEAGAPEPMARAACSAADRATALSSRVLWRVTIDRMTVHLTHWGAFESVSDGERLTGVRPWRGDPEPTPLIDNVASAQHHPARIAQPHVRKGWLEHGPGAPGRGDEPFVPVSWDTALDLLSGELRRVCTGS